MHFTYKGQGLGQAKPEQSQDSRLWPGPGFEKAEAASGQAKARALRPSWAGTALVTQIQEEKKTVNQQLNNQWSSVCVTMRRRWILIWVKMFLLHMRY
jgi:hypothetical protein